jgi:hypothetical protein
MTLPNILPRRRHSLAILLAAGGLAATPLAARAADPPYDPTCHGRIALGEDRTEGQVAYSLACSDDIAGYSIVTLNRQVASFDTEPVTLDFTTGEAAAGQDWSCAGPIPSQGVTCSGKALGGNKVVGHMSLMDDPCVGKRPDAVFTVADAKGRTAGPFPFFNAKPGPASRPLDGCPKTVKKTLVPKRGTARKTPTTKKR